MKTASGRTIFTIIFLISLAAAVAASGADVQRQLKESSAIEKVIRSGKLRVGIYPVAPWATRSKTGEWIGFEVDVAKKLAQDMDVKAEFVPAKWESLIPDLLTDKFDLIVAGMVYTPQRALKINFTTPYDYSQMNMVANRKVAAKLKAVSDFNRPEVIVLCRNGTSAVQAVTKLLPKARLLLFSENGPMVQTLLNGMAHAVVASSPEPAHLAIKYPETLFFVDGVLGSEPIAMGVRKGDPDTLAYLNNWIPFIRKSGFIEAKADYWFNGMDWRTLSE